MDIVAWGLFGVVNSIMLYVFENDKDKVNPFGAVVIGVLGALAGGTLAYLIFGGVTGGINTTLLLVILFQGVLLYLLFSGKSFKKA